MPPRNDDDDWSESDEDDLPDLETSVLLGIPDGAIVKQEDIDDAAVSRLGGYPALLPRREPSLTSAQCKNCSSQMELLVQLWCPLEDSPHDRALYVWGCSRSSCQRKDGSVRAFRGLRFNDAYATKLEKKRAKKEEICLKRKAEAAAAKKAEEKQKARSKVNPFSMSSNTTNTGGLFGNAAFGAPTGGIGTQLFGIPQTEPVGPETDTVDDETATNPPSSDVDEDKHEDADGENDDEEDGSASEASEVVALAATSSAWRSDAIPAYTPPQYLSTDMEYVPAPAKPTGSAKAEEGAGANANKDSDAEKWNAAMEGYENSMDLDHVFERFVKRVGYEGEQCIRYELGGTPLPYASDEIFNSLFPTPLANASGPASRRTYNPSSPVLTPCPHCGSRRVFECQLMPNLINVLKTSTRSKSTSTSDIKSISQTEEERKRELARLLKGKAISNSEGKGADDGEETGGMEWGTCMVFSCEKDCCVGDGDGVGKGIDQAKECWREELVLVQWEEWSPGEENKEGDSNEED